MGGRAQYEIPAKLKEAQERFEQWRSSQTGSRPIPERLWGAGVRVGPSTWSLPHGPGAAARLHQAEAAHAGDGFGGDIHISPASCVRGTDRNTRYPFL
jgi:hypothetical protein